MPLFFCTHTGSVATPNKHLVPSPLPGAHTYSVHQTHTTTPDTQHHAIHAPTPYIQCIHLQPMYNTVHPSILNVQDHPTHVHTQITTQRVHMLQYHDYMMHIHNTTCPQHNMYDMHTILHVH